MVSFSHNARALTLAGFDGDIALAARLIEESFLADGWEVFADVRGALEEIRRLGMPMGVVSNWPANLEMALERANLRAYFDVIVASGVVGYAKPHPEIFRRALRGLGVLPHRALHVGDSVELDVLGAAAAGIDVVLIDRAGPATAHAKCIARLPDLLTLV